MLEEIQKNAFNVEEYKNGFIELDGNIELTQNAIEQLLLDIKNLINSEKIFIVLMKKNIKNYLKIFYFKSKKNF